MADRTSVNDPEPIATPAGEPYAMGVLGPIPRSALGFVLPHEHLTVSNVVHHVPVPGIDPHADVSMGVLGDLRVWPHAVASNMVLDDDEAVLDDLVAYRKLGGATLVEQTPKGMARDLTRLADLSRRSGVNVIAGTGYYVARAHGPHVAGRSAAAIAAELVADLTGPSPSAGVIGEIGISVDHIPDEWLVLDAALLAQQRTGAPLWIHQTTTAPMRSIMARLGRPDVPRERVVLCHTDYDLRDVAAHRDALDMGLNIEFDLFGFPAWNRRNWVHAPNDTLRIERLLELAADGHLGQLLISHDVCLKMQLRRYGGFGYGHLLAHVRELFDTLGGAPEAWSAVTSTNPARLLAWHGQ